jgi:type I restriction enzyme R subunit
VLLTHLRTEAQGVEENLALTRGSDSPGVALPGEGAGKQIAEPIDKLSALVAALNERFGMNLTDADKVWFEQQRQVIKQDERLLVVALNNDRDQFRVVMESRAEDAIVERHEANGQLFGAFFEKPGFREAFLDFLATTYDEFRAEDAC